MDLREKIALQIQQGWTQEVRVHVSMLGPIVKCSRVRVESVGGSHMTFAKIIIPHYVPPNIGVGNLHVSLSVHTETFTNPLGNHWIDWMTEIGQLLDIKWTDFTTCSFIGTEVGRVPKI